MNISRIFLFPTFLFAFLSACSEPEVRIMSRSSGQVGTGVVLNTTAGNSGPIEIDVQGETYSGTWVAVRDSGSIGYGLFKTYAPSGLGGTATTFAMSTSGLATALLRSNKGNTLRCDVRYDAMSVTGIGVCQKQNGEVFDLQVL